MSTSPALLNASSVDLRRPAFAPWIAVAFSLAFITFTSSTLMSGYHTQFLVDGAWKTLFGNWHYDWTGVVNGDGRKVGHFFGYGAIGLLFRNAWHHSLRYKAISLGRSFLSSRILLWSAVLSTASIFLVACADELHQHFLPQRVGSFGDVIRDTAGTIFLNLVWIGYRSYRRRKAINAW